MAEEEFGDEQTVELVQAANEPEARGIESLLRDQGIECTLVPFADRAYPGILDRERTWGKWGAIRVARADHATARRLVEDWRNATPVESGVAVEDPITPRTRRPVEAVLKGLVFAASLAANLYFYITYVVQPPQAEVEFKDGDGRVIARYKYRPSERYAYETLSYDARGHHVSTSFDRDADGWPERWIYHYGSGLRDDFADYDEDGHWEVNNTYRGQRLIGVANDSDEDGLTERSTLLDEQGREARYSVDHDKDTFADEIACRRGSERIVFDLTTCSVR